MSGYISEPKLRDLSSAILAVVPAARTAARVRSNAGAPKFEGTSHKAETFELCLPHCSID